jgi:hypothetical protein
MANADLTFVHPSQAHWPTERAEVIKAAVRAERGVWPPMLGGFVMFYMGERITRAEFDAVAKGMK